MLCRQQRLDEAEAVINQLTSWNEIIWMTLLGSIRSTVNAYNSEA